VGLNLPVLQSKENYGYAYQSTIQERVFRSKASEGRPVLNGLHLTLTENSDAGCILCGMKHIKSILVFGATGSCGRAVVERGVSRGLLVTAYVRNEAKAHSLFDTDKANLTIVTGELSDDAGITKLLSEHDAVVSCLSSFEPPHDRMSMLARFLADYAGRSVGPVPRLIVYSLSGVEEDGDWVSHSIQRVLRIFSPGKFGPAIQDHQLVARILARSSVNYTLFQTATMIERPIGEAYESGSPEDCPGVRLWDRWGVLDAADVCLDSLDSIGLRRLQMRYLA